MTDDDEEEDPCHDNNYDDDENEEEDPCHDDNDDDDENEDEKEDVGHDDESCLQFVCQL